MSETKSQDLKNHLFTYLVHLMRDSNPYATKRSMSWKVLEDCADILGVKLESDRKTIRVHPENIQRIEDKWQNFIKSVTPDEKITYERVMASQNVEIYDLTKLVSILLNKKGNTFLYVLLAVDGFLGYNNTDLKNYIENLKLGSKDSIHAQTVRELLKTNSPLTVYHALLTVYEKFAKTDETKQMINNVLSSELSGVNEDQSKEIADIYRYALDDEELETIAAIKLTQLAVRNKKTKSVQRKKVSNKKRKLTEE